MGRFRFFVGLVGARGRHVLRSAPKFSQPPPRVKIVRRLTILRHSPGARPHFLRTRSHACPSPESEALSHQDLKPRLAQDADAPGSAEGPAARPGPHPAPAPAQDLSPTPSRSLAAIYARPGFKLRRAHQIALSVFAQECRAFEVTSTQYGILVAIGERPGLDQVGVAQALGLDRSTTGMVVGLLEERGLLRRDRHATDGRRRVLTLSAEGARLLEVLAPAAERARLRLLAPLSPEEARTLTALLDRLMDHHDALVRVPLMRAQD